METAEVKLRHGKNCGNLEETRKMMWENEKDDEEGELVRTRMTKSASEDRLDLVSFCAERDAALEETDKDGFTLLMRSAASGQLDEVGLLIERDAALEATEEAGSTPLILSAEGGHLDVVRLLVNQGASLEATDVFGSTPLIEGAANGHLDVVRLLVEVGAALDSTNLEGLTALMLSAENGHSDVVQFLFDQGSGLEMTNYLGSTPLILSSEGGHLDVVRFLTEHGAALNAEDKLGRTPLMWSALRGHLDVVQFLLEKSANVSMADYDGNTSLMFLLCSHVKETALIPVICQMISNGASVEHHNKRGESVLTFARVNGFRQLKQVLSDKMQFRLSSVSSNVNTSGISSPVDQQFSQSSAHVNQVSSNSETNLRDELDAHQLASTSISEVAGSRYATSNHFVTGTAHVIPDTNSPPFIILPTDKKSSNTNSLMALLKYVADRCILVNELAPLFQHVNFRLQALAAAVDGLDLNDDAHTATLSKILMISTRLRLLLDANVNKPVVFRFVSVRSVVETLTRLRIDLEQLEAICIDPNVRKWWTQWELKVASVKQTIVACTESSLPTLFNELPSDKLQIEAMALLICELKRNKQYYSHRERDLMQMVHTRIVGFSKLQVMDVEGWFIPQHEVTIDLGDSVGSGSFGVVYRGMWRKSEVVVKSIRSNSEADKRAFFREVAVWHRIRHRNIVPFLGACHLASPYFMVCEYAPGGTLTEYLYRQRQKSKKNRVAKAA